MVTFHLIEPTEAATMVDRLDRLAFLDDEPDNWRFETAAALGAGRIAMIALCDRGADVGLMLASFSRDKRVLHVRGLQSLRSEPVPGLLDAADRAALQLARDLDAAVISFETQRPGLIADMMKRGFQIDEVRLTKDV